MFCLKQLAVHSGRPKAASSLTLTAPRLPLPKLNTIRFYSQQTQPPRPKATFNRSQGTSSARAPRASTTSNVITFLAVSSLGVGAYVYQWSQHRENSFFNLFSSSPDGISTEKWTPVVLKSITPVSDHTSLFEFQLPKPCKIPISSAIYVKDDEIQAMRAYTPIHSTENDQDTIQLLIKRYSEGQVSRFMHSAKPGQKIEMRGPILIWPGGKSDLEQWDEIGMIAGGTGVTAFLPIIHSAVTNRNKKVKVSLLVASQSPEELYFKDELDQLAKTFPDQLRVAYTVDKAPVASTPDQEWKGLVGYVNEEMLQGFIPQPSSIPAATSTEEEQTPVGERAKKSIVLICGPENMVKHVSGTRGANGQEPIRGILGDMGYQKNQVFRFPN
ncbi:NADH-cytochrome b5 reductase [Haplosporangium sp. Z 11]|nr:NADH-cytochrome b5 reductase [Haplosporangium sp. Z 11]